MFNDIFKDTDFGNIKNEKEENEVIKDAAKKDIWHTGQKPDMWAVEQEAWDIDDLDEDDDIADHGNCDDHSHTSIASDSSKPQIPSSPGIFDDIF